MKHVPCLQVAYNQMGTVHKDSEAKTEVRICKHCKMSIPQKEKKCIQCLLYTKHCTKYFTYINIFNLQDNSVRQIVLIFL